MAREVHRHYAKFVILTGLIVSGIALIALPTPVEQTSQVFSAPNATLSELDASIGYAPPVPGYYADAHITVNNPVTVKLMLVKSSSIVLFSDSFQAGTFDIPKSPIIGGGNVFLTIQPSGSGFTQMNVFARIFHDVVTYQFAWLGIGVLGLAGLFSLAILRPETGLGKLVYKILPIIGRW